MELLFGVIGRGLLVAHVLDGLATNSVSSNPGITLTSVTDGSLALSHAGRHFVSLKGDDPELAFHLDGEIQSIAGVDMPAGIGDEELYAQLAAAYRADSGRFWEGLDGSFCLLVRDWQSVSIGADAAGTRSVYWWIHGDMLAFHSHLADLAPTFPAPLTEDAGAVGNFLGAGMYPPRRTAFREVGHLGAGQYLRFERGQVEVRDHLSMIYSADRPRRSRAHLVDELVELVSASVATTAAWMRRPVVPLSGGLDSRYLLAELKHQSPELTEFTSITWGEDRTRPASDALVAARVAASLGVTNKWFEKPQHPTRETFARAIYLSSGEADCAIHFPDDHVLHGQLAEGGFVSLLRGDECFGNGPTLITRRAVFAVNGIARLSVNEGYAGLIEPDRLKRMAEEQDADLAGMMAAIASATPTGARDELRYSIVHRRVLASYNRVKHADLEVFTPFLSRPILEWLRGTPDSMRFDKVLLRAAFARRFPRLASIPFATRSNLPDWDQRWRHEPELARFYHEWCGTAGWLDGTGSQAAVLAALDRIARVASLEPPSRALAPGIPWKAIIKRTLPGRAMRELTLERRYHASGFERIARLAVLHRLIGDVERRVTEVRIRSS